MHFLLGFLLGYYTRNKPLLAATLTDHCPRLFYSAARNRSFRARLIS